jgi:hypothetical protein
MMFQVELILFQIFLFFRVSQQLQVVVEVVDVSNLARNGNAFSILSPDLSVENHGISSVFIDILCVSIKEAFLRFLMSFEHQVRADHNSCSSFTCFAMNSGNILWVLLKPIVAIDTKLEDNLKRRRIMVIE